MSTQPSYPAWAPPPLVKLYRDETARGNDQVSEALEQVIAALVEGQLPKARAKAGRLQLRNAALLPHRQRLAILNQLIRDDRMRTVWPKLKGILAKENGYAALLQYCFLTKVHWYGYSKRTRKRRQAHFNAVRDSATALAELIEDTPELEQRHPVDAIEIPQLLHALRVHQVALRRSRRATSATESAKHYPYKEPLKMSEWDLDNTRFLLRYFVPSLPETLREFATLADKLRETLPQVGRPNAKGAESVHFARSLCHYFKRRYGKPFYEEVAAITNAALNLPYDLDADLVRKNFLAGS